MKSARHTTKATIGKAVGRLFWRWPLALSLALAVAISLFHDLPAFAGGGNSKPRIGDGRVLHEHPRPSAGVAGSRAWVSLSLPYDGSSYCEPGGHAGCFQRAPLSAATGRAHALLCRAPSLPSPPRLKRAP